MSRKNEVEALEKRLLEVGDYLAELHDDCPYYIADSDARDKERYEKKMAVSRWMACPPDCTGYEEGQDVRGCWRRLVMASEEAWESWRS